MADHDHRSTRRQLVSLQDAAEQLGVTTKTIRRHISTGRLTGYRVGSALIRVDPVDVAALAVPIPTAGRGPDAA